MLEDAQWPVGVLGLVAGQVAQETGRPTILLSTEGNEGIEKNLTPLPPHLLARGSARSANHVDLYQLVKDQAHLLHRFGGHPFAAGLSLPVENIPLFTAAINQRLRQSLGGMPQPSVVQTDLLVRVADLGKELFRELKLLEPCGMGNPAPKLLLQNCWFENAWHRNQQDWQGKKVQYIKTEFDLRDDSTGSCFAGVWWGHYKDELPPGRCDAVVELDYNTQKKRYEIRLLAVRPSIQALQVSTPLQSDWILDWRQTAPDAIGDAFQTTDNGHQTMSSVLIVQECPTSWDDLQAWFRRSLYQKQKLALAYPPPTFSPSSQWQQLVGIAKYLSRTSQTVTRLQLHQKLGLSDQALQLGFQALNRLGFKVSSQNRAFSIMASMTSAASDNALETIEKFLAAAREEQFQRQYFYEVPLATIQAIAAQTV